MGKRGRTTGSSGQAARGGDGWKVVFLPGDIELELVGVIEGGGPVPGAEVIENLLLDAGDDLLAIVRDLDGGPLGGEEALDLCFDSASAPEGAPVH